MSMRKKRASKSRHQHGTRQTTVITKIELGNGCVMLDSKREKKCMSSAKDITMTK